MKTPKESDHVHSRHTAFLASISVLILFESTAYGLWRMYTMFAANPKLTDADPRNKASLERSEKYWRDVNRQMLADMDAFMQKYGDILNNADASEEVANLTREAYKVVGEALKPISDESEKEQK